MSLTTISFGHSFYNNAQINTPTSNLIQSPIKKRRRSNESQINFPSIIENELSKDKKTKYTNENKNNQNLYEDKIIKVTPFYTILDSDDFIDKFDSDLRDQARLITNSTPFQKFSNEEKKHIRSLILTVSQNGSLLDNDAKCADLGVLYFNIASRKVLNNSSFVEFRTKELITEAKELKKLHKERCPENLRSQ
ncbi:MAG TPA: hypothetical protein VGP47_05410, partial [Parachlamydiaceae bacterium]|nr:hypothetical protein [Parachlamydiaceae bacterium]